MSDDKVRVPPGHKVVVIHPVADPQIGQLESNFLVVDFGLNGNWRNVVGTLENAMSRGESPPAVAILQRAMLDNLQALAEVDDFIEAFARLRARGWTAVWVLPNEAADRTKVVIQLQAAGFGVHGSAPDGACFVEVHKPDGTITVGMAGPSL